ncbi:MAG: hypothetical protein R2744_13530 [Bacteroidales bacterium]
MARAFRDLFIGHNIGNIKWIESLDEIWLVIDNYIYRLGEGKLTRVSETRGLGESIYSIMRYMSLIKKQMNTGTTGLVS